MTFDYLSFYPEAVLKASAPIRNKESCRQLCSFDKKTRSFVYYGKTEECSCLSVESTQLLKNRGFDKLGASKKCSIKFDQCVSISGTMCTQYIFSPVSFFVIRQLIIQFLEYTSQYFKPGAKVSNMNTLVDS